MSDDLKLKFAYEWLKHPNEPFKAAQSLFDDVGEALRAASEWVTDPTVLVEKQRLLSSKGARHFLPTKEDYARKILDLSDDEKTPVDEKRQLLKLFGEVMGYIEKPQPTTINNNVSVPTKISRVIVDPNEQL